MIFIPTLIFKYKRYSISNSIFYRNEINDLEWRIKNSQWWVPNNGKYDAKELKQVRWLENAIKIYMKALKTLW